MSIAVVIALAAAAGCGSGGGGGGNDNGTPGDPTSSATPARTATCCSITPARTLPPPLGHTAGAPTSTTNGTTPEGASPTTALTPAPTATPTGPTSSATIILHVSASTAIVAFQFSAHYPTTKGSFTGSAATVHCTTPSRELFTKNDKDDGTLILSLAHPTSVALPATITCTFDVAAGQQLQAADVAIDGKEVTVLTNDQKGVVGDPSTLAVDVDVP